jgi:anhydro-N-acetylmuramic acid kinase
MSLCIGLMSGTSMDGIDAVLLDTKKHALIQSIMQPYEARLQEQLQNFDATKPYMPEVLLQLDRDLGEAFANAVLELLKQTDYKPEDIMAIGSHGQTLYHNPDRSSTLQLGCAHTIVAKTGITVVSDFRTRDMVLGGQGAPLAPYYHHEVFKNKDLPLALVNVGGIANLTILNKNHVPQGYDTGPGNVLMDAWIQTHQKLDYDEAGAWASSGHVIESMLERLLEDAYFQKASPKSVDKAYFSQAWLQPYLDVTYAPEDVQATLLELTARSIADAIKADAPDCKQLALCGGGAQNIALRARLSESLPNYRVDTTDMYGVHPDYLEAMMMAWLSEQALLGRALDLTQITGSSKPAIHGVIYPK